MHQQTKTTLGISAGTRLVGIAVVRNRQLIDWKILQFKERWSREKLKRMLNKFNQLYDYYRVSTLALKSADPFRSSPELNALIGSISLNARSKRVKVSQYSLQDLKELSRTKKIRNVEILSEYIVEQYPELRRVYLRERNNENRYYVKVFEAIAAAKLACDSP